MQGWHVIAFDKDWSEKSEQEAEGDLKFDKYSTRFILSMIKRVFNTQEYSSEKQLREVA